MTRITTKTIDPDLDQGKITFYNGGTLLGEFRDLLPENVIHVRASGGDDSSALQTALDSNLPVYLTPGSTYNCANLTANVSGVKIFSNANVRGNKPAILKKNANGPILTCSSVGAKVELEHVQLDGNGGTYTGVGVDVQYSDFNSYYTDYLDFDSYCIDYTANDTTTGSFILGGRMTRHDTSAGNAAIRMPASDTAATNKRFLGIWAPMDLMETRGTQTVLVVDCDFQNIIFSTASKKVVLVGNRMSTLGADTTVAGTNHCIVGNCHAGRFVVSTSATSCLVGPNLCVSASVDNSTAGNNLLIDNFAHSRLIISATSAPPDASLAAGQLGYWFDSTAGAARVMFKAKDAGGTVRSASLAMV